MRKLTFGDGEEEAIFETAGQGRQGDFVSFAGVGWVILAVDGIVLTG